MLTQGFLTEALQEDFDYSTTAEGRKIFENQGILTLSVSRNEIEATVLDRGKSFFVHFERSEDGKYIVFEGYCTCGKPSCKHQAATLCAAIAQRKKRPARPVTSARTNKGTPNIKPLPIQLEGTHAGEYRLLPMSSNLQDALSRYRPKRYQGLAWSETFEGTFITPDEIEFTNIVTNSYYFNSGEKKIRLKVKDGEVYVRCLSCTDTSKKLCTHQMALLIAASNVLNRYDLKNLEASYQSIVKDAAEKLNTTPEILTKHYQVKLLATGPEVASKHDNMVGKNWIEKTQKITDRSKEYHQELVEKQTMRLQEGRGQRYAFVWSHKEAVDGFQLLDISYAKGGAYKTKPGIKDLTKKLEDLPYGFPQKVQELGQQLFFFSQEENPEIQFDKIKFLIEENMDELNEIYHYTFKGTTYPHTPRVSELNLVEFVPHQLECKISFENVDGFTHLTRHITHDEAPFDYKKVVYSNPVFCSTNTTAYLFSHHRFQEFMDIFPNGHDTVILPIMDKLQKTELVNQFKTHFDVSIPPQFTMEEEILTDAQLQILLREAGNFILFEPRIKHGEHSFNAFDQNAYFVEDKLYRIDEEDREFLINFLRKSHSTFDNPIQIQDYVFLDVKEMINNYWFIHFNEACEAAGIEVLGQKELSKFNYSKHRAKTYMHIKSGIDWFDVEAGVSFGDETVKTADWIRALRNKESFIKLKDGSLGMLPAEWLEQASKILAVADVEKGNLKISKYRFNIIEDLFENIDDKKIVQELEEKKARLRAIDTNKKYPLPQNVTATLRDYQKHGFEWLKFLDESGFGGILADDMGLGKTLQVITLLADQINQPPSLVVVPRSLLFNWGAELDKFCPELKYEIHHGTSRAKNFESLQHNNIIITTYHTATNDIQIFKDFKFNYIILDESQAIKNPDSKRYKAMRLLQSRNKLAMTGTPIENNTFDLYAQLSFTSPGLLGGKTSFKNNFSIPIDSNGDAEAAKLLRKLTHPFILRRTKDQVAKDLPEKTETVIYCEMGTAQRKLYEKLKTKIKQDIEEAVEEKGVNQSKFQMLDGLLRLRQMCNSPLLVNPAFSGANADSVKINTLVENLTEALDQKHHALVFSQFVSLLSIIRTELDKRGIQYAYLDGSTTNRQAQVEKFMNNDEVKIFLIS
ncbi:MAG: DEAD/DEAH box helicase, partial [Bacteroidota bacterium]